MHYFHALYRVWLAIAGGALLCGCAQTYLPLARFPQPTVEETVTLAAGDTVDINFAYWPELNDSQKIRPDGKVSLRHVGDIAIAGLTPAQAARKLETIYDKEIKNPVIDVILRTKANHMIYVGGQVKNNGVVELTHAMTLAQALIAAGGLEYTHANAKQVIVVRQLSGKNYATAVDMDKMFRQANPEPFYLAAGDIVYVPRTKISELNQWVEQYIKNMLPGTGFKVDVQHGETTLGIGSN